MTLKNIIIFLGVTLLLFVVFVDPFSSAFAPKCIFKYLTGYDCPACGIQRALHTAMNGDIATALRYNYFLIISIPYFGAVAITTFYKSEIVSKMSYYVQHPKVVKVVLALIILWWVILNIPYIKDCFDML